MDEYLSGGAGCMDVTKVQVFVENLTYIKFRLHRL
jgi:hypothetical protein